MQYDLEKLFDEIINDLEYDYMNCKFTIDDWNNFKEKLRALQLENDQLKGDADWMTEEINNLRTLVSSDAH